MTTSIETIVLSDTSNLGDPDVTRLTTKVVGGTGVFDVLMTSVKAHVQEEYDSGRATGDEYSKLYLGALQAVLQTSIQFLLNSKQEEQIQAEIALTRQRTVTELANTDDDIPIGLGFNGSTEIEGLVKLQKDKLTLESDLVDSQILVSTAQKDLAGQQIVSELAQTSDDFTQVSAAGYGYNTSVTLAGLLEASKAKAEMETDYTEQRIVTEVANTSDVKPIALGQITNSTAIDGLVSAQKDKIDTEVTLLAQKANTELSQTANTVMIGTPYLNTSATLGGLQAEKKDLYAAQTSGFSRDAEQKAGKILTDAWTISATKDERTANTTNNLDDASLGEVITKLKEGIGIA